MASDSISRRLALPPAATIAGYTLIEVLVVVALLGVIVGMATLSIGDGGRATAWRDEALRLRDVLALASQQALTLGRTHGLRLAADGYRPLVRRDGGWLRPGGQALHAPRTLPDGLSLALRVDDVPVPLNTDGEEPQVQFRPGGDATAFELRMLAADATQWVITGGMSGTVAVSAGPPRE